MTLPREDVETGLIYELGQFEILLRTLTPQQWEIPSRCEGWTLGDIARHNVGSIADVATGRLDGLGTPEVTAREVAERAGHTIEQLADECAEVTKAAAGLLAMLDDAAWDAPAGGSYDGSLGNGVEALWFDAWMHADDIRSALGIASVVGPGLRGALSHVEPFLRGLDWNGPIPNEADAGAFEFVMVATGRARASTGAVNSPVNIYA